MLVGQAQISDVKQSQHVCFLLAAHQNRGNRGIDSLRDSVQFSRSRIPRDLTSYLVTKPKHLRMIKRRRGKTRLDRDRELFDEGIALLTSTEFSTNSDITASTSGLLHSIVLNKKRVKSFQEVTVSCSLYVMDRKF